MRTGRRLSICYAAPGHRLVPYAGPTRNVLSVADALSQWADVTVAFRSVVEPAETRSYRVMAIDAGPATPTGFKDDNAARGIHPIAHLAYCRRLQTFAAAEARSFDVVLEKGWRLSGLLACAFQRHGVPGVVIENDVRAWTEPLDGVRQLTKYALHVAADRVASSRSRRASAVVAETPELKRVLMARRRIAADRVEVVGLGVDHALFHPRDQDDARRALDISEKVTVLLYVGAMDEYHDLGPIIDALARERPSRVELHVVGGGEYRGRYEGLARHARVAARFHGHVPHASVPHYIAAADLCLSPYRTSAFHDGTVTFSTLKIPEYLACGRPVVVVAGGSAARLVVDGVTGFVRPNDVDSWRALLTPPPRRDQLLSMGAAAARAVEPITWRATAARYLEICQRLTSRHADQDEAVAPRAAALAR